MSTNPFIQDLKSQYKNGSALIKLILINVAVFLLVHIIGMFLFFFTIEDGADYIAYWLSLPASISNIISKPWTIISYMFLHTSLWHILMNMLWLYFGGRIFIQFLNEKKLVSTYLLGGLTGGLIYILAFNLFPVFENVKGGAIALGASASVMAVLIGTATYVPNFVVKLMFLGDVKLKYIGLASIVFFVLMGIQENPGGNIAHLGGAIFGFLYIQQLKKGNDFAAGFSRFLDMLKNMFKPKKKMKVVYKKTGKTRNDHEYNAQKKNNQAAVDAVLDKIKKSGYDSLTGAEKAILFDASKK